MTLKNVATLLYLQSGMYVVPSAKSTSVRDGELFHHLTMHFSPRLQLRGQALDSFQLGLHLSPFLDDFAGSGAVVVQLGVGHQGIQLG